jgi:hypothetical protein
VYRHRSIEAAKSQRQEWEKERIRTLRPRRPTAQETELVAALIPPEMENREELLQAIENAIASPLKKSTARAGVDPAGAVIEVRFSPMKATGFSLMCLLEGATFSGYPALSTLGPLSTPEQLYDELVRLREAARKTPTP